MEIQTPEPGWRAEIYGAGGGRVPESIDSGWTGSAAAPCEVGQAALPPRHRRQRYRYYLVWITALPPGEQRVEISELALFCSRIPLEGVAGALGRVALERELEQPVARAAGTAALRPPTASGRRSSA